MYDQMIRLLTRLKIGYTVAGRSGELRVECFECLRHGNKAHDRKLYIYCGSGIFICYRCNWKGKVTDLSSHIKALYGDESGSEMEGILDVPSWQELESRMENLDYQTVASYSILPKGTIFAEDSPEAMEYLLSRGVSQERVEEFCLMYTDEGYFADHLIIPITSLQGNMTSFVARTIRKDVTPKYKFPKGCRIGEYLYNAHSVYKSGHDYVWITEGVFDAIHCYPHAVATFGKHITDAQIRILRSMNLKEVTLLWDWDAWHDTPDLWVRAVSRLRRHFRLVIPVCLPNPHSDPTGYTIDFLEELVDMIRPQFEHLAL